MTHNPHQFNQPEDHDLNEFASVIKAVQKAGRTIHPPRALLTRILSQIHSEKPVTARSWWGSWAVLIPAGVATILILFTATLVVTQTSALRETMTRGDAEHTTKEELKAPVSSLRVTEDVSPTDTALEGTSAPLAPLPYRVSVFLPRATFDMGDCVTTYPSERRIAFSATPRTAIDELLKGITPQETAKGFVTSLLPETSLRSLTIIDGVAHVEFDNLFPQEPLAETCRVQSIRSQIEHTLMQFSSIRGVVISAAP